jgi:quercetin dioxygenase-like cupin family protein
MARVIKLADIDTGWAPRFEGHAYGARVSFFVIDAPAGVGPGLHTHPYEETFVVLEGSAVFTAADETLEVTAGHILIVPPETPHAFTTGADGMRSVNIHGADRMSQTDL